MLQREVKKQKDLLIINDVPVKTELKQDKVFSSESNLNLLTAFRTGRVNPFTKATVSNFKGVNPLFIHTTYIDMDYFGAESVENNFDFCKEIKKKSELTSIEEGFIDEDGIPYYKLEHQKDCYLSERLHNSLMDLLEEIRQVNPTTIVVTGKWGLFFLAGCTTLAKTAGNPRDRKPFGGLATYRGSILKIHECFGEFEKEPMLFPMYHTIHQISMPDKVPIMEIDIQKICYRHHKALELGTSYFFKPKKEYVICDTKEKAITELENLLILLNEKEIKLSIDIETIFKSVIDCIGIASSKDRGICIPFAHAGNANFWSLEDEIEIMILLREVLTHKNALQIGQNYSYDCQYYYSHWGIIAKAHDDTMNLNHIIFNYLPKNLAFLASIYCEFYTYWKDDITALEETPETRWKYNIDDILNTYEVLEQQYKILEKQPKKLQELYYFQQRKLQPALVKMMNRGVRIDVEEKERLLTFFAGLMTDIEEKINSVLGFEFNMNSTPQKRAVFKEFLGISLLQNRKTGNDSCDSASMLHYMEEYPIYRPFLLLMLEYASLKVFVKNFLSMQLDDDQRARTQYNLSKTPTGRLASTKNVRGKGGNFQNIPSEGKIDLTISVEVLESNEEESVEENSSFIYEGSIQLPNIKKIFLPDPGMELADYDLSGADIQIVAADSQCKWLLDYFENPKGDGKVYRYIASEFLQRDITDKEYKTYKGVFHGTNYLMQIKKLAAMSGLSLTEAKELQDFYFYLCPEVKIWHKRIESSLKLKGYVENIFGRRSWYLNTTDKNLQNKACAFIPQSSIADLINRATVNIDEKFYKVNYTNRYCDILLQVHDSLVFQYPISEAPAMRELLKKEMVIDIPYTPILRIPSDYKISTESYGDVKKPKKAA